MLRFTVEVIGATEVTLSLFLFFLFFTLTKLSNDCHESEIIISDLFVRARFVPWVTQS